VSTADAVVGVAGAAGVAAGAGGAAGAVGADSVAFVEALFSSFLPHATTNSATATNGLRIDISQRFDGRGGADTLNGATGDGRTTIAEYNTAPTGVVVNLGPNALTGDFYSAAGIETVHGGTRRGHWGESQKPPGPGTVAGGLGGSLSYTG